MKILITGSTGLLGGRLTQFLDQNKSHKLLLGTRDLAKLPNQFAHLDAVAIDWTSQEQLNQICDSVDCIIHLAGMNAQQCARASVEELAADVRSTEMLVNAAINNGVKRFIYLSTAHVYSSNLIGKISESTDITNEHPYALNHVKKERLVSNAADISDMESIVIRLTNAFGPPVDIDTNCWMLLVNDLCKNLVLFGDFQLRSNGCQVRDFIPISDFCEVIDFLLGLDFGVINNEIFNVASGWALTVSEMANEILKRYETLFNKKTESIRSNCDQKIELEFDCEKLKSLGFNFSSSNFKVYEIDSTLKFCQSFLK